MNPVLETPRLRLRPFRDSDASDVYAYAKDPAVGPLRAGRLTGARRRAGRSSALSFPPPACSQWN